METEIREMLRERAGDVGGPSKMPAGTLRRARRRRVSTGFATVLTGAAVAVSAVIGVNALRSPSTIPFESSIRPVLTKAVPMSQRAERIALGFGSVWVENRTWSGEVVRIDPTSGKVLATIPEAPPEGQGRSIDDDRIGQFHGLAVGEGSVWTTVSPVEQLSFRTFPMTAEPRPQSQSFTQQAQPLGEGTVSATFSMRASPLPGNVPPAEAEAPGQRNADATWRLGSIDPGSNALKVGPAVTKAWIPADIAAGEGAVWAVGGFGDRGIVYRLDPKTLRVTNRIPIAGFPVHVEIGAGSVWVGVNGAGEHAGKVLKLDPSSRKVVAQIPIRGFGPVKMAIEGNTGWVASLQSLTHPNGAHLYRLDLLANRAVRGESNVAPPTDLAISEGYLFASLGFAERIEWLNTTTGSVVGMLNRTGAFGAMAVGDGRLIVNRFADPPAPQGSRVEIYELRSN